MERNINNKKELTLVLTGMFFVKSIVDSSGTDHRVKNCGLFSIIFMREITLGHKIKSEVGYSIDLGSFLMS